ncbi:MAG: heme exporter protein CcmB [candidate division Zixibacteria bacterium]|nr:heme exporter protein CcmB [candidate division Zixibacteria bacterium]
MSWAAETGAILKKELRSELRRRWSSALLLLFGLVTVFVVSFSLGAGSLTPGILSAFFWVTLFFASTAGLSRSFLKEEETKTILALRLLAGPAAVFWGKFFFNLFLLLFLELVLVPLFFVWLNVSGVNLSGFILILALGSLGLVAGTTLSAAMVAKAESKGVLFVILAFPILAPLLIFAMAGTKAVFAGFGWEQMANPVKALISYVAVVGAGSSILFDFIWEV